MHLSADGVPKMSDATERFQEAIKVWNTKVWNMASSDFLTVLSAMLPGMTPPEIRKTIEYYGGMTCGMKIADPGSGGHLAVTSAPPGNALKIRRFL